MHRGARESTKLAPVCAAIVYHTGLSQSICSQATHDDKVQLDTQAQGDTLRARVLREDLTQAVSDSITTTSPYHIPLHRTHIVASTTENIRYT